MKRWALISGDVVAMIVEQDSKPEISGVWVECPYYVGPGWLYQNGEFISPDIPEPVAE